MVDSAIRWRPAAVGCALLALGLLAPGPWARAASIDAGSGVRIEVPVGSKNSNLLNDPDFMTEMLAN